MKLNNKGVTVIELIISVALVSVVMLFLYQMLSDITYDKENEFFASGNQVQRIEIANAIGKAIYDDKNTVTGFNDDNNNLIAINMDRKEGTTSSARTYCINYSSESGIYYVAFYYVNSNNCSNTKQDYQKWQLRKGYTLDTEKNLCSITSTEKYNIVECSIRVFTENTSNNKDNNNTLDDIVFSFKYNN